METRLSRRYFLQASGALGVALAVDLPAALGDDDEPVVAAPVARGKTLVLIFLRGGADGLNLIVPHGDRHYYRLRRELAIAAPGTDAADRCAIDLDGTFGLHPRLAPLAGLFEKGIAVAAHAVGHEGNTRSHFEEQDVWETGRTRDTLGADGWVNRHLVTSTGHGPVRAVAIGDRLPRILRGEAPAFAIRGLDDLALPDPGGDDLAAALAEAYGADDDETATGRLLSQTGRTTLEGIRRLASLSGPGGGGRVAYPGTEIGRRLEQAARLIRGAVGVEVIEIDADGWDTHTEQGWGPDGPFGDLAGDLAAALAAFAADLEDRLDDVLVATLSDFGRTAAQNGNVGTDHGWGNCLLALGGPVAGRPSSGPVVADWPGLAPDQLRDGRDLAHTVDFRDVLAELVRGHLGNSNLGRILPDHRPRPVGLIG